MAHQNSQELFDSGAVFTYSFVADSDLLSIDLIQGTTLEDNNPLIGGLTLEVVPSPAGFAVLGCVGLMAGRRRRRA